MFQKGTLPKWSKEVHKIVNRTAHTYTIDNGKVYKYYELLKVKDIETLDKPIQEPTREQIVKENKTKRTFKKSGLELERITNEKRERKQVQRLTL